MTQSTVPGTIEVVRAGPLSTVRDLAARARHLGVAQGGALDGLALEVGNRLVGNRPDAAAVEITIGPAAFRFTRATRIAITGTEFGATLDGQRVYSWWSLPVEAGQTLVLPAAKRGMRGYLCIAGGIDVLPMLGSRSTDLASRFGGLGGARCVTPPGRRASGRDGLPRGRRARIRREGAGVVRVRARRRAAAPSPPRACAVGDAGARAADYASFAADSQQAFWDEEWLVTANSNRMGYRLAGVELVRERPAELLSHAVLPGTIRCRRTASRSC